MPTFAGMKTIICDGGSTKAAWWMDGEKTTTPGVNPLVMNRDTLLSTLPPLPEADEIWYYGAGCTEQAIPAMRQALSEKSGTKEGCVHVASDMLGAARALCQHEEGMVAILGTGSNSCLYDGSDITSHIPALGFILGDEGSGAVLGRTLVGDLYKGVLPEAMKEAFETETGETQASIINKVYGGPAPNRFLASLVPFIARHRAELREMLVAAFSAFVERNLVPYGRQDLVVHFVGGVASQFKDELRDVLAKKGFKMGCVENTIIDRLALFHVGNN